MRLKWFSSAYNPSRAIKPEEMEHENKKRGREEEEEEEDEDNKEFILKSAKRQDAYHHYDYDYDRSKEESESYTCSSDKYLGSGVFDFPWLHDEGMISKSSEEWNFQDAFSSLHDTCSEPDVEFSKQFFYEIPTNAPIISFPENNFGENGEDESVDCIWSSLLNQPLHHICI